MLRKIFALFFLGLIVNTVPAYALDSTASTSAKDVSANKIATNPAALKKLVVLSGTISQITGNNVTITKDSQTWTVQTNTNSKIRYRFGGKAALSDFAAGDEIIVVGRTTGVDNTVLAILVRDLTVGRRVIIGQVTGSTPDGWTINTQLHGTITVNVATGAKLINRTSLPIKDSDIKQGDRLRVGGIFSKPNLTLTADRIKDYNLPAKTPETATTSGQTP